MDTSHEFRRGPGRPGPNPKCGLCGIRQNNHTGETPPQLYWRISRVANMLDLSYRTIWGWVHDGKLPVVYLAPRCPRIPAKAVQRLIEKRRA